MKLPVVLASCFVILGCAQAPEKAVYLGNDGLPSAEVIAFEAADARLNYRNSRIEYDARDCMLYQGVAADGQVRSVPLLDKQGQQFCVRSSK